MRSNLIQILLQLPLLLENGNLFFYWLCDESLCCILQIDSSIYLIKWSLWSHEFLLLNYYIYFEFFIIYQWIVSICWPHNCLGLFKLTNSLAYSIMIVHAMQRLSLDEKFVLTHGYKCFYYFIKRWLFMLCFQNVYQISPCLWSAWNLSSLSTFMQCCYNGRWSASRCV